MGYTSQKNPLKIIANILLVVLLIGSYLFFKQIQNEYAAIDTFQACVDAGYPVLESYPEQCKIPGKVFTNTTQVKEIDNKEVVVTIPEKNMNPRNASYDIEGQHITLENGKWVPSNSASSSSLAITYLGNELRIDVNKDGQEDTLFVLVDTTQVDHIFYYLVAALNINGEYVGTNGVLLGDRISPKTTEWRNNEIVVTYMDRVSGDPMTKTPNVQVSRYFTIENSTLAEIQK